MEATELGKGWCYEEYKHHVGWQREGVGGNRGHFEEFSGGCGQEEEVTQHYLEYEC